MQELIVTNEERIDSYLSKNLDISRSKASKLILDNVLVNGKKVKNSYIVKKDDKITISEYQEEEIKAVPEKMDLDILYEDDDVIVVNKANGMVVHPAIGNTNHTLVNGLLYHSKELSKNNGEFRPGIVHRIDAYTTGLLMIAKNDKAHEILAKQLSEKKTYRKYIALVWGVINNDTGTIDAPIGRDVNDRKKMAVKADGKEAITHFKVLKRYKTATLIELRLETVYGKRKLIDDTGQCLHAKALGFNHPKTGKYMEFECDLPECFTNILKKFEEEI